MGSGLGAPESAKKSANSTNFSPYPLRVHAGPPIFGSSHKAGYEGPDIQQMRALEADEAKPLQKHKHMGGVQGTRNPRMAI